MDLWRASALQNAFSGASAHDDSAARAAEDNLYMCVRRQLGTAVSPWPVHSAKILTLLGPAARPVLTLASACASESLFCVLKFIRIIFDDFW